MRKVIIKLYMYFFLVSSAYSSAADFTSFEGYLKANIDEHAPGVSYIATKGGEVVYSGGYGLANLEEKIPLSADSIFSIASLTKQITAAAIMLLHERGMLHINDDIKKYIPQIIPSSDKITIENLLTHTSGLERDIKEKELLGGNQIEIDRMLSFISKEYISSRPGDKMKYSNIGYILLGKIIEVVSGQNYSEFIENNIFNVIGMNHSFYGHKNLGKQETKGYFSTYSGNFRSADMNDVTWSYAAGGVSSSVRDFALWYHSLVSGKLVKKSSLLKMVSNFNLNDGTTSSYGYGLNNKEVLTRKAIMHQGKNSGYSTSSVYYPEEEVYIAVFSNNANIDTFNVLSVLSAELLEIKHPKFIEIKLTRSQEKSIVGKYKTGSGDFRTLFIEDGIMYSKYDGAFPYQVIPLVDDTFLYKNSTSYFTIKTDNSGHKLLKHYQSLTSEPEICVKL